MLDCGDMQVEAVDRSTYLGSVLTEEDEVQAEVKERIAAGTLCVWSINSLFSSGWVAKKVKLNTFTTIIQPVVTYGSRTWRLTKRLERRLEVFENGVLHRP